jgi:hypothetical protein
MTYLPLAIPKLDHDSLREILSSFSTTVRDKSYSPPLTGNWQPVFSTPRKDFCTSTSSITRQPCLSACSKTLPMDSYIQNELASQFLAQF